jgi:hypothetical protein
MLTAELVSNAVGKQIWDRRRPLEQVIPHDEDGPDNSSFPSGHRGRSGLHSSGGRRFPGMGSGRCGRGHDGGPRARPQRGALPQRRRRRRRHWNDVVGFKKGLMVSPTTATPEPPPPASPAGAGGAAAPACRKFDEVMEAGDAMNSADKNAELFEAVRLAADGGNAALATAIKDLVRAVSAGNLQAFQNERPCTHR